MADGSMYLYQGLTEGARALSEGLQQYHRNKQEDQFLQASFEQMTRFASQSGVKVDPEDMAKFSSGSLGAKRALVTGLMTQFSLKQQQEQMEERRRHNKVLEDNAKARLVISEQRAKDDAAELEHEFIEDPVTGQRYMIRGKTSLPSGVNPELANIPEARVIQDDKGNPIFHALPTGKGGWVFRSVPQEIEPKAFVDPKTGKEVPGVYLLGKSKVDLRTDIQKLGLEEEPEIAPREEKKEAAAANDKDHPAMPKNKADLDALPSGAYYINPADGKMYRKK